MKRRPHHWFITGTDTEVGKTMVTGCMAAAAATRGTVVAAKPLASGVSGDDPARDASILARAAGHPPKEWATATAPVSPHRAFQPGEIEAGALRSWVESLTADTVLIEGVGGWRVPLLAGRPARPGKHLPRPLEPRRDCHGGARQARRDQPRPTHKGSH